MGYTKSHSHIQLFDARKSELSRRRKCTLCERARAREKPHGARAWVSLFILFNSTANRRGSYTLTLPIQLIVLLLMQYQSKRLFTRVAFGIRNSSLFLYFIVCVIVHLQKHGYHGSSIFNCVYPAVILSVGTFKKTNDDG